jgi:murein DD-endopeptidase MepM/ murein hydrolase activator NlpD
MVSTGVTDAAHPDETTSAAIYRIPYADGTLVDVVGDAHNHGGANGNRDRIDMQAVDGAGVPVVSGTAAASGPASVGDPAGLIVASASGIIRVIEDDHGDDYGRGDGLDAGGDPQADDSLEHLCTDDSVLAPDETCTRHNNFVWIEHANGEWTKYSHLRTGTVRIDYGWTEGDTIDVGDIIGAEGNVGFAFSTHLHYEVAELGAFTGTPPANIGNPGGFISNAALNHNPRVCDATDADFEYVDDNDGTTALTAADCVNSAPVANAGGDYFVDEGSTVMFDGTASSDIHNAILSYSWSPAANLDDPTSATPVYSGIDDTVDVITLTVDDEGGDVSAAEALTDDDDATVTVENVTPTVAAVGDDINEAGTATVSATFTDPGTLDTHTATIDWDDGTPPQAVSLAALASGVDHVYGDNGTYTVIVTVTDDDGGQGSNDATVNVGNIDPTVDLDTSDAVSFPGGDYVMTDSEGTLNWSADASDVGSDDLTFTWSTGDVTTYFNDGVAPDPFPSPLGTFPFDASDAIVAAYSEPGVETLELTITDDDGGTADAEAAVVITGTADTTMGFGWWKHQLSGNGSPHIDDATLAGYLEVVEAVSGIFSEVLPAETSEEAHALLSTGEGTARDRATAQLLLAWLQFASGAVSYDATVPLGGGTSIDFLELMLTAEDTIVDPAATSQELGAIRRDLASVRHADG